MFDALAASNKDSSAFGDENKENANAEVDVQSGREEEERNSCQVDDGF